MWRTYVGAGALVVREGLVLLVLRERSGATRWELPSGLVEPGESLEDAARRETREETGLKVVVGRLLCTVVMEVPEREYRGINAYFCATPTEDALPHPCDTEPIRRAEFVDIIMLHRHVFHPVDSGILYRWQRRNQECLPFFFHITL